MYEIYTFGFVSCKRILIAGLTNTYNIFYYFAVYYSFGVVACLYIQITICVVFGKECRHRHYWSRWSGVNSLVSSDLWRGVDSLASRHYIKEPLERC